MRYILTYNGKSSADVGIFVGLNGNDSAPARSYESVVVPGRSGALTIDNGRYENISVTYTCFIRKDFDINIDAVRAFFLSTTGYGRLEDSAHPDEYRMARISGGLDVTVSQMREQGYFSVEFDCMPQRWLKSGEIEQEYTASGTIYNPTRFASKPMLRVYGNGTVGIGSSSFTLAGTTDYTDIDCERMDAYYGATNRNSNMTGVFPAIEPGQSGITLSGVTKVIITPKWWNL